MKKRILFLITLLFTVVCAFCLEKLNVGSYQIGEVSIGCYDDQSIRIKDLKDVDIILDCIDVDTAVKASDKIREIVESKSIVSIEQMIKFFDKEKIEYKYKKYGNDSNYYVETQSFLEEYLVPKYGIKSGKKTISSSGEKTEYKNWNNESKQYDYEIYNSSNEYSDDYTLEYKNWNKNIQGYEYKIYRYPDHTTEYKDFNKEKDWYDYCIDTYSDHTSEYKDFYKEKDWYDYRLDTYSDHTVEYKNWNKEKGWYDYCLGIYSDHTTECRNWNRECFCYDYWLDTYSDHIEEYKDGIGPIYKYKK